MSGANSLFGASAYGLPSAPSGGSLDGGLAARIGFVALRVIWGRPSVRLTGARPFFVCCGPIGCMVGALEPPCLAGEGAPTACCWADIGGGGWRSRRSVESRDRWPLGPTGYRRRRAGNSRHTHKRVGGCYESTARWCTGRARAYPVEAASLSWFDVLLVIARSRCDKIPHLRSAFQRNLERIDTCAPGCR